MWPTQPPTAYPAVLAYPALQLNQLDNLTSPVCQVLILMQTNSGHTIETPLTNLYNRGTDKPQPNAFHS